MPLVCSLTAVAAAAHSGSRLLTTEESHGSGKLTIKAVNPEWRIHNSKLHECIAENWTDQPTELQLRNKLVSLNSFNGDYFLLK